MPLPVAPLIMAGSSVASNILGASSQANANRKNCNFQREMYGLQRSHALADWQMQNEYNSPAQQMQRYRDAGLSPHLIYGQTNEAAPVRSAETPTGTDRAAQFDLSGVGQGALSYYDLRLKEAQTDNATKTNSILDQEKILKSIAALAGLTDLEKKQFDLGIDKETRKQTIEARTLAVEKLGADISKAMADTQATTDENDRRAAMQAPTMLEKLEAILTARANRAKTGDERNLIKQQIRNLREDERIKKLDRTLKEVGVQPSDNFLIRLLGRIAGNSGPIPGEESRRKTEAGVSGFQQYQQNKEAKRIRGMWGR